ncbi:MAG: CpsD/CapB family tyrosine-protein kinase [Pseudomonadota bacterium]
MDPISKALERAKQEGQSVRDWVRPGATPAAPVTPEQTPVQAISSKARIKLDQRHLSSQMLLSSTTDEDPVVTDRYRLLRTRVLQLMRANGWRSLGVTSPGAKAGKTVTSINLAFSVAREGNYQIALIDADIRKPSAAQYMGIENDLGLPDFLENGAELEDVWLDVSAPAQLSFVSGESSSGMRPAPDVLKSERMTQLINFATQASDNHLVIIDLPPALIGDDVLAVSAHLDALLIVVDESSTKTDDLKQTVELLSECNILGTVLNKSTEKPKKDPGYYQYQYHYNVEDSDDAQQDTNEIDSDADDSSEPTTKSNAG